MLQTLRRARRVWGISTSGVAADSRLDECEREVRRESQTPMDQWPRNLWHQTGEGKAAFIFLPAEFPLTT